MKKNKVLTLLVTICLVVAVTVFLSSWAAAESTKKEKLVWSFSQMPTGKHCDSTIFGEWLPKRLAEATGGQLEFHAPIGLVQQAEVLESVRKGTIQGGLSGTPYCSGQWPLGSSHAIPGILKTDDEYPAIADILYEYWGRSLRKKYNIQLLGVYHWPGIHLYCNKPIRTVDEFKGKKLRGMGYYDTLAFEEIGASGVYIPWDEAFLAMQRGVADGLVTGTVVYDSMGFWKYCKYIHEWPIHGRSCAAFMIVNGNTFDSLPDDLKPVVKKVFREAAEKIMTGNNLIVDKSLNSLKERGCQVIEQSEEEIRKCLEMTKGVRKTWIDQCEKAGSPEAREMLEKIDAFLADYRTKNK
jgi:TRAP-type C4-dicarboxylate transport system substrate-binding protein